MSPASMSRKTTGGYHIKSQKSMEERIHEAQV